MNELKKAIERVLEQDEAILHMAETTEAANEFVEAVSHLREVYLAVKERLVKWIDRVVIWYWRKYHPDQRVRLDWDTSVEGAYDNAGIMILHNSICHLVRGNVHLTRRAYEENYALMTGLMRDIGEELKKSRKGNADKAPVKGRRAEG